ncbi:MAG: N-formylglutamate amidohydrolase [Hyphobacterium sp.]|nr:MAG: N-formylglutamate amidohydrolase [Hyphobacterium sp.]
MAPKNATQSVKGMDPTPAIVSRIDEPVLVRRPAERRSPILVTSPHSGRIYPPDLLAQSELPLAMLRRSEDAYVDVLIEGALDIGLSSIIAAFPRVFVDPNRSADELDPGLFTETPPGQAKSTPHVEAGLGVIPRISANGRGLYAGKLPLAEGRQRIADYYRPYHGAIDTELKSISDIFGVAILLDVHSMPAAAAGNADIVLGDRHGRSCAPEIVSETEQAFRAEGLTVRRNRPYAGGHTTSFYGQPGQGRHALQIEINRELYLDEETVTRSGTFDRTQDIISAVLNRLVAREWQKMLSKSL